MAAAAAASALAALPTLGAGYSYRRDYRPQTFAARDRIGMLEVVAEHFFAHSTRDELALLAEHFPLVPHGLDLSLGSADGVDDDHLTRFADVVARARAPWWGEHVAFTRAGDIAIGHLAPLPFTREALDVLASNLARVRDAIDVPVVLENIAAPAVLAQADMSEARFLRALHEETGCGLLLDIENLHANAINHGEDVAAYLDALPRDAVVQLHVAGGEWLDGDYVDSHAHRVAQPVWELVADACARFPIRAITIERDENLPPFDELLAEIGRAHDLGRAAGRW